MEDSAQIFIVDCTRLQQENDIYDYAVIFVEPMASHEKGENKAMTSFYWNKIKGKPIRDENKQNEEKAPKQKQII
jgi:hypothetical protein